MARGQTAAQRCAAAFSPHTRGWPVGQGRWRRDAAGVLPAHAGMARTSPSASAAGERSPRTRGDGPKVAEADGSATAFSPHTRGWPGPPQRQGPAQTRSPRTRGDGPLSSVAISSTIGPTFSPHTRGWPADLGRLDALSIRSPRTRGDGPGTMAKYYICKVVLPAHAGMARRRWPVGNPLTTFSPHTRGWPGERPAAQGMDGAFSPHTRGWPAVHPGAHHVVVRSPRTRGDGPLSRPLSPPPTFVLPAHAGMARNCKAPGGTGKRSPRTRGDGPSELYGWLRRGLRSPRTRGDGPALNGAETPVLMFSPHTRGWPDCGAWHHLPPPRSPRTRGDGPLWPWLQDRSHWVLPAHAGMAGIEASALDAQRTSIGP